IPRRRYTTHENALFSIAINMHTEIQLRIDRLQASKQVMEATIAAAGCDPHRAPQGEWSIAQVLEHLLASEGGTLGYMKKKSSGGWDSLEVAAAEHNEKSAAIHARLESNERYKAPDVLPEPTNAIALEELLNRWNSLRNDLINFASIIPSEHFDKLVFRQPVAGMLTALQALDFMDAHLRHHLPQIERIRLS
ncbi:MAG: DinB family protein, partial [Flavobacteriales bacterium]